MMAYHFPGIQLFHSGTFTVRGSNEITNINYLLQYKTCSIFKKKFSSLNLKKKIWMWKSCQNIFWLLWAQYTSRMLLLSSISTILNSTQVLRYYYSIPSALMITLVLQPSYRVADSEPSPLAKLLLHYVISFIPVFSHTWKAILYPGLMASSRNDVTEGATLTAIQSSNISFVSLGFHIW